MQLCAFSSMQAANLIITTTSKWVKYLPPRRPAARMRELIVGQLFDSMTSNRMTSVLLILQFSSDTPLLAGMRSRKIFGPLRLWIWLQEVFEIQCQVRPPVKSLTDSRSFQKLLGSSGSALRAWRAKPEKCSHYLFPLRFRLRVKYPSGPSSTAARKMIRFLLGVRDYSFSLSQFLDLCREVL